MSSRQATPEELKMFKLMEALDPPKWEFEKLTKDGFEKVDFSQLEKGDKFRCFERTLMEKNGNSIFTVGESRAIDPAEKME